MKRHGFKVISDEQFFEILEEYEWKIKDIDGIIKNGGVIMKKFTSWSLAVSLMGILIFSSSYVFSQTMEILSFVGFFLFSVGVLLGFIAMFRKEKGKSKYLPVIAYFVLGLIVVWKDPFKVVWLLTWMKNNI